MVVGIQQSDNDAEHAHHDTEEEEPELFCNHGATGDSVDDVRDLQSPRQLPETRKREEKAHTMPPAGRKTKFMSPNIAALR